MTPKVIPSPLNPLGRTEEQAEDPAVRKAKEVLQMLDPLLESPHFQAFWKKFGEEGVLAQMKIALDPATGKKKRHVAAQVHHALKTWYEYPMKERAAAIARIRAADTRQQQRTQADPPAP